MKKSLQSLVLLLMALIVPTTATAAYEQLADGVYMDGTTLYITSGVTSLGNLQVDPSEIYCYAAIPPACMANTFNGYGATLHVPVAGMVSYFTALYWYNFNNILSDAIEPLSVTMNDADAELEISQQLSLSATVAPGDATPKTVYWSSTDASVATVSGGGTVTAVTTGECDIIATCVDKVAVCHVTVVNPRVTITLNTHEARLLPNHTLTLTATCSPIDVDLAVISSNPRVAIPRLVNGAIMVVGVSEGTATITVNAADGNGNPDSCVVTVYTEPGDVNSDGYVNISDVTALIDYLLSGNPSGVNLTGADCNDDGNINISDVTTLIDFLLSGEWSWEQPITYTVNGVSFKMIPVKGGTFMMGATTEQGEEFNENELPIHKVSLSDYSIGETEVTQALWQAVMGYNPSNFTGNMQSPVENVSWYDCKIFLAKLNQLTGKTFRLPTEAEWEFAARGGNKSQGYKYAGSNTVSEVAWYYDYDNPYNSRTTHTVATKAPNELGLYDMSGNVSEWCYDWYGSYSEDAQTNPDGISTGSYRVRRGGSWAHLASGCRVSYREECDPEYNYSSLGLRLTLGPDISPESEEHEWVDLGLPSGTLWATCNVGANAPEEYGDYFAWGETAPKDFYNWSNYKWCNGSETTQTKYCMDSDHGTIDGKTELDPEDDAAYVNWGPSWRMPTKAQQDELRQKCTWVWTTLNGVNGQLVTGPNGNSIFLPAAGFRWYESLNDSGVWGTYWSRTLQSEFSSGAYVLNLDSGGIYWSSSIRDSGTTVRAVRVSRTETFTVNGVSFHMVTIEGGTFTMGLSDSSIDSQKPAHEVTLSGYSIGQTEVTQELWQAVMGYNPSNFTGKPNHPVETVSWNDCQEFISKLNEITGKTFRLPTEAEWEFAARGGNKSQGYKYAGSNTVSEVAWYKGNAGSTVGEDSPDYGTHVVGTKGPNELGIYDMSGNVWEWCQDWYGKYSDEAQTNPTGPNSGSGRVRRGGCYLNLAGVCSVYYRVSESPATTGGGLGLRLAL